MSELGICKWCKGWGEIYMEVEEDAFEMCVCPRCGGTKIERPRSKAMDQQARLNKKQMMDRALAEIERFLEQQKKKHLPVPIEASEKDEHEDGVPA